MMLRYLYIALESMWMWFIIFEVMTNILHLYIIFLKLCTCSTHIITFQVDKDQSHSNSLFHFLAGLFTYLLVLEWLSFLFLVLVVLELQHEMDVAWVVYPISISYATVKNVSWSHKFAFIYKENMNICLCSFSLCICAVVCAYICMH